METQMHQWVKEDAVKVKLMKMSKGWQWEITYENTNTQELLYRIGLVNNELKWRYKEEGKDG